MFHFSFSMKQKYRGMDEATLNIRFQNNTEAEGDKSEKEANRPLTVIDEKLESKARQHRQAARLNQAKTTLVMSNSAEPLTMRQWIGKLPERVMDDNIVYSKKIFVGGLPYALRKYQFAWMFSRYGAVAIQLSSVKSSYDYHQRDIPIDRLLYDPSGVNCGFAYVIFETGDQVARLLRHTHRCPQGSYFMDLPEFPGQRRNKKVQLVPWRMCDYTWSPGYFRIIKNNDDIMNKNVFIGALHGMITARALAQIMIESFGEVVYASIDTDNLKYPIGSGRVTFKDDDSYKAALSAGFLHVTVPDTFKKVIQIDPYLDHSECGVCCVRRPIGERAVGRYYCRECFMYFCGQCWNSAEDHKYYEKHIPIYRDPMIKMKLKPTTKNLKFKVRSPDEYFKFTVGCPSLV